MSGRLFKWAALLVLLVLMAASVYGFYLYRQVRFLAVQDNAGPADVIVVLGAAQYNGHPSPVFKARLDHAFDLYKQGLARAVITTGGYGPDPNYSEAHVGSIYLVHRGIHESNIVTEQGSGTTRDSVRAASGLMKSKGWTTALVVSDGFHLYRTKRLFEQQGIVALTSPVPESPIEMDDSKRFSYSIREVLRLFAYRWVNL